MKMPREIFKKRCRRGATPFEPEEPMKPVGRGSGQGIGRGAGSKEQFLEWLRRKKRKDIEV